MEIIYAFDKDSKFQKKIQQVYKDTGDLTTPLLLMADSWRKGNRTIFDPSRQGPGRYQDLSVKYGLQKARDVGFIYPILLRTGALDRSITEKGDKNAIALIENRNTLVLGTKVEYGIYHQSQEPREKMPYRPFLFVGVEQIAPHDIRQTRLKNWIKILDNYWKQAMDKK